MHLDKLKIEFDAYNLLEEVDEENSHNDIKNLSITEIDEVTHIENLGPVEIPMAAHALVTSLPMKGKCQWDLYDLGASHHMSPCREDFLLYQEMKPKPLLAANKEIFMAYGIGEIIISVPFEHTWNQIRLTNVLYTPVTVFTLISVGKIDNAGYYTTFGGNQCEIRNGKGDVMGRFPKTENVYKVRHQNELVVNTAIARKTCMSLKDLHEKIGQVSLFAIRNLIWKGIIEGVKLTDEDMNFQCQPCILAKMKQKSVPRE